MMDRDLVPSVAVVVVCLCEMCSPYRVESCASDPKLHALCAEADGGLRLVVKP